MKKLLLTFLLLISLLSGQVIQAESNDIIFYYSQNCPHCEKQATWLKELEAEYHIEYRDISLYQDEFQQDLDEFDIAVPLTPLLIYEGQAFSGYLEKEAFLTGAAGGVGCAIDTPCESKWYGKSPLVLVAVIFGLLDGFNPCAMWVLIIMITFLLRINDQKRLKILGFTFVFTTGIIYYLIMNSWLHVSPLLSKIPYFTKAVAIIVLVFAAHSLIKLKQETGCQIEQSSMRKKTITTLDKISQQSSLILSIIMVALLAILVNLIELACSLGFPVTFVEILKMNHVNQIFYQAYLLIYVFFFILDDLIILIFALKNKKLKAISSKHKKKIQIASSLMLIILALILLFQPQLLQF